MGIEPFLVASSVVAVLAQRLLRQVCPDCKRPYTPDDEELIRSVMSRRGYGHIISGSRMPGLFPDRLSRPNRYL